MTRAGSSRRQLVAGSAKQRPRWVSSLIGVGYAGIGLQAGLLYLSGASGIQGLDAITLLQLLSMVVALIILLATTSQPTSGGPLWTWGLAALGLGTAWMMVLLRLVAQFTQHSMDPLISAGVALATGVVLVVHSGNIHSGLNRSGEHALQVFLEFALIAAAALLMASGLQVGVVSYGLVQPELAVHIAIAGMLLFSGALVGRTSQEPIVWMWCSNLCRLIVAGLHVIHVLVPAARAHAGIALLETLSWMLLATAAACTAGLTTLRIDRGDGLPGRDAWRRATVPRLYAMLAVASLPLAGRVPMNATIVLALIGGAYELVSNVAQRRTWMTVHQIIQAERTAHDAAQAEAQQTIGALARLIHDQAPPLQGLWSVQRQLEQCDSPRASGTLGAISHRLLTHLEQVQVLADQLHAVLRHGRTMPVGRLRCVDVMPICIAVVDAARDRARLCRVELHLSLAAGATNVLGDPTAIRRVLENLVTNALDVTSPGGQVCIEIWDDRAALCDLTISVRDSGPGLRVDQQAHALAPRENSSAGPGLGIGLAIVAELTQAIGGTCGVDSIAGRGSTFWVRFPHYREGRR
jgi:signal transduction histidine kinase